MKADFTRDTFHPFKRYARVLMQQGRVQLDADWNEQAAIQTAFLRSLTADLIGPFGGPAADCGFVVSALPAALGVNGDFQLSAGHYYVQGVPCELRSRSLPVALSTAVPPQPKQIVVAAWTVDGIQFAKGQYVELFAENNATPLLANVVDVSQSTNVLILDQDVSNFKPISLRRVVTYLTQPDLPVPGPLAGGTYLVYLDVWERFISYVEDDSVREVALNGAETAARSKIVCQVKLLQSAGRAPDPTPVFEPVNRGFLRARTLQATASTDPCTIAPDAQYRGAENQLYRVEIHTGGTVGAAGGVTPTFKWSRENGSVVFPIARANGGNSFVLESFGRDDRFGLVEGDTVELQDDDSVLLNLAENLLVVQSIDRPNMTVTLSGAVSATTGKSPAKHPLLRRWDLTFGDPSEGGLTAGTDGAALIVEGTEWLDLESGIQIQFPAAAAGELAAQYRTGDYWLIPARVTTGDVIWPNEPSLDAQGNPVLSPLARPPHGIQHWFAPLANVDVAVNGAVTVATPLTKTFPALAV